MLKTNLVRVLFERDGSVNLAHATADKQAWVDAFAYYNIVIHDDPDYNATEDKLPEALTTKLAILKLAPASSHIDNIGFVEAYNATIATNPFYLPDRAFYVEANFFEIRDEIRSSN
jgi:hypothetical protein